MARTMAARSWLLLLCLSAAGGGVLQARAQADLKGFISIDCGLPGKTGYVDDKTKLSYAPDDGFTDGGTNRNISVEYMSPSLSARYHNVRSFPDGERNCYTLQSLEAGLKYLIRATFLYGNYDGLRKMPVFDLYIGVNFWTTVNMSDPSGAALVEAIVVVLDDFVQVCMVNTGTGTPFISGLDVRPLESRLYPQATETQGLVLYARKNFGATSESDVIRYPEDIHDRAWLPWVNPGDWLEISTTRTVQNTDDDKFGAPTAVMQTAITPRNASKSIEFSWDSEPQPKDPTPGYIAIFHIAELQLLPTNALRQFTINLNGKPILDGSYTPPFLYAGFVYNPNPLLRYPQYNISIRATANSTLPPIINAVEVYSVIPTITVGTDYQDASAMIAIKAKYQVNKNWMGDPCVPKSLAWNRLTCSYTTSSRPRITSLNLSSCGLTGGISSSFTNLKALQSLDLSNNNLTGSIPDALSELPSLTFLDLTGNQLNGTIPSGLLKKNQDGSLDLRYGSNPNLCSNGNSCQLVKRKTKLVIYIVVPIVLIVVIISIAAILFCLRRRRPGTTGNSVKPQNETMGYAPKKNSGHMHSSSLRLENRRFTYQELEMITCNFQRELGRGGFGCVYNGFLEDRTRVAVKLMFKTSKQGNKEFLTEAQILTRIHHKNLVSMIGYCKDGDNMALVYEYMSEGTLQEHITENNRRRLLPWKHRLQIVLESAQGLEYLHKGCNPPLIHRDVKAANILLNEMLEAKIADFGLSKAFNRDNNTHVSTITLAGTPGYVDPEYLMTMQPTTKSDVYSFGVVILELVTGKPAILHNMDNTTIVQWVRQHLAQGNIEDVVDARMHGNHDINSLWKAVDIALKCTMQESVQRPTMTDVVAMLQECIDLENRRPKEGNMTGHTYATSSGNYNSSSDIYNARQSTNVIQNDDMFEVEHNIGRVPTMATGPTAR